MEIVIGFSSAYVIMMEIVQKETKVWYIVQVC